MNYLTWLLPGLLAAPQAYATLSFARVLMSVSVVLGVILPFRGITLLAALLVERWVLRYVPSARNFLGLN